FAHDVRVAETLKAENPDLRIGFVGAHVAVDAERALRASEAIEFVARNEFDLTIQEVAQDRPLASILGLSYRSEGRIRQTPDAPLRKPRGALLCAVVLPPGDLGVGGPGGGSPPPPSLSLPRGRGGPPRCSFCLGPQPGGGPPSPPRGVGRVVGEIRGARRYFP